MNKKRSSFFIFFMVIFLLTGCNHGTTHSRWALFKTVDLEPVVLQQEPQKEEIEVVQSIKQETGSVPSIYDVAVVKGEKNTLVAYKVKHLSRFRMKGIEKELKEKLEENFPDEHFTVSSDFKIFLETVRLSDHLQDTNYSEQKAQKRLLQIIKLNDELT